LVTDESDIITIESQIKSPQSNLDRIRFNKDKIAHRLEQNYIPRGFDKLFYNKLKARQTFSIISFTWKGGIDIYEKYEDKTFFKKKAY